MIDPLQECECMANRRKANRIRRDLNVTVSKLRNFDEMMRKEKKKLEELYEEQVSQLEKVV